MNDIEQQISQNANNKTFEYKEAYWDSALAKLKTAEAAKRRKGFFWIFFGTLLFGGIGTFFIINNLNKNELVNYSPRTSLNEKLTTNSNNNKNTANTPQNNQNNIKSTTPINTDGDNNDNEDKNLHNQTSTINSNGSQNTAANSSGIKVKNQSSDNLNTTYKSITSTPTSKNNTGDVIANNNVSNANNTSNNSKLNSVGSKKNTESMFISLFPHTSVVLDTNTGNNTLAQYSSNEKLEIISRENDTKHKLSFVINVGALASQSFNENNINFDFPYLGGELYYQINNKFNVSIGGGWYKKSRVGYINNYISNDYGFGKNETTTVVSFDKIYFAEIPLKINYALTPNHLIGLGGSYSFILGSENRIFSNQTNYGANGTEYSVNDNEEKIAGLENSYTKSSQALFVSYEYRKNRLGAEIRYYFGLNDITNDNIFEKTQFDRNSRLLFTLKYLLFK